MYIWSLESANGGSHRWTRISNERLHEEGDELHMRKAARMSFLLMKREMPVARVENGYQPIEAGWQRLVAGED